MWINYKGVMLLLEVGRSTSYKIIDELQDELKNKGYIVNPNKKVPINYLCDRFGIDAEYARNIIENSKKTA